MYLIKRFYICVSLIFTFGSCLSESKTDSLRNLIDNTIIDTLKVTYWNKLSMMYSNEGRFSLAEKSGFEALEIAQRIGFTRGVGKACYQIGITFSKRAKYDLAMQWYLKAIAAYEKINDNAGLGYTYVLIGVIDYYLHNYDKAELNYLRALKYFEGAIGRDAKNGKANCIVNLAFLYTERQDYNKAIQSAEEAYKLFKESNSYHGMGVCKTNIANCYLALFTKNDTIGNRNIANEYLSKAVNAYNENLVLYKSLKMPSETSIEYVNLFGVYFGEKKNELAKLYLDSAFALIDVNTNIRNAMSIFESYYKLSIQEGDSAKALSYYLKYETAKDSLFNMEKAEKLENLNLQLQETEKQKEIDLLTKDKEKRGLILWGVGLLALLAICFSILIFKRFRDKQTANLILHDKNKIIEQKNKEITDSIRYAKRIQTALMPNNKYIERTIKRLMNKNNTPKS